MSIRPLPVPPYILERTHFRVPSEKRDRVAWTLSAALTTAGASCLEFNENKFKFKGAQEQNNFRVVVWGDDEDIVVEFMRRSGCHMWWHGFYDRVLSYCGGLNKTAAEAARHRVERRGYRLSSSGEVPGVHSASSAGHLSNL